MGDYLVPTDYTGKDKNILRKTIGDSISIIDNPNLSFKITYRQRIGFEVRLNNGCFYDLFEQNDMLIEHAANAKIFEYKDEYGKLTIQNGYSPTQFFDIMAPINNHYNQRSRFLTKNKIERSEFGYYTTYNLELINAR